MTEVTCPRCGIRLPSKSELSRHEPRCQRHPAWPFATKPATAAAAPKEKEEV